MLNTIYPTYTLPNIWYFKSRFLSLNKCAVGIYLWPFSSVIIIHPLHFYRPPQYEPRHPLPSPQGMACLIQYIVHTLLMPGDVDNSDNDRSIYTTCALVIFQLAAFVSARRPILYEQLKSHGTFFTGAEVEPIASHPI